MKYSILLMISVLFFSCKTETASTGYLIEGNAPGIYNGIRSYIMTTDDRGRQRAIDTAIVMNEKFVFEGQTDNPDQYVLTIDNVQRSLPFLLTNETMTIDINKSDITKSEIKGSQANADYNRFNKGLEVLISDLRSISNERRVAIRNKDTALAKSLEDKLREDQVKVVDYGFEFIKDNPESLTALVILGQQLGAKNINAEKLLNTFNGLGEDLKTTKKGRSLNAAIQTLINTKKKEEALAIGKMAPTFEAPSPEGNTVSLGDIKGKVTIIDFWAAWCGPCRRENPNVVRIYEKYHDKGLEIIGVSLDGERRQQNPKKAWTDAIEKDGLKWHQVSNLKYFNDPVAKLYNIEAIPATFILDEEGKIVAKNLRGKALENKIMELLEKS